MPENWRWKNLKAWREKNPDYQKGASNPFWKGGLSKSTVNRITKRVLTEAGVNQTICKDCKAVCPAWRKRWDIHHEDENRANNVVSNLTPLCPKCHSIRHKDLHESRRDKTTGRYLSARKSNNS